MYKPRCDHMPQISYAPNLVHKQDSQNLHSCILQNVRKHLIIIIYYDKRIINIYILFHYNYFVEFI